MKNGKLFVVLFFLTVIAVALISLSLPGQQQNELSCIEPHLAVVPSPMPQENPRTVTPRAPLTVPAWWKPLLNADQQAQYENITLIRKFYSAQDILVYENQIWVAHANGLVRFDATHNEFKTYQIQVNLLPKYYNFAALHLQNREIWAILSSSESALAKYDSAKDEFLIVHDKDGLLSGGHGPTVDGKPLIGGLSNGKLVFVLGWEIFTYDPINQRAEKLLGLESGIRVNTIAISKDDIVWLTAVNDHVIRSLNPETGKLIVYGEPPSLIRDEAMQTGLAQDSSKAITVDSKGRVWVGYFDRLESDQSGDYRWHEVKRPTIFVDDTHIYDTFDRAVYVYKWTPVNSVIEFSDGKLWFVTGIGAVAYDMNEDNWCWSAPQPFWGNAFSPIAEDENGDIWMVDDGTKQIYKLER